VSLFKPACSWEEKIMVVRPTEIKEKEVGKCSNETKIENQIVVENEER
jgi:hypothetical protein